MQGAKVSCLTGSKKYQFNGKIFTNANEPNKSALICNRCKSAESWTKVGPVMTSSMVVVKIFNAILKLTWLRYFTQILIKNGRDMEYALKTHPK